MEICIKGLIIGVEVHVSRFFRLKRTRSAWRTTCKRERETVVGLTYTFVKQRRVEKSNCRKGRVRNMMKSDGTRAARVNACPTPSFLLRPRSNRFTLLQKRSHPCVAVFANKLFMRYLSSPFFLLVQKKCCSRFQNCPNWIKETIAKYIYKYYKILQNWEKLW